MQQLSTESIVSVPRVDKIKLKNFIEQWESFKNCYFWTPPTRVSARRSYERYKSAEYSFRYNNMIFNCTIDIRCSCKNIYVTKTIKMDSKIVTLRELKKVLKLIENTDLIGITKYEVNVYASKNNESASRHI